MPRMQIDQKEDQINPRRIEPQRNIKCVAAACSCTLAERWRRMKEDNSLQAFLTLCFQTSTIYHYLSQDNVPDRASRKHYFSSHNYRKIFGRRHQLRLTSTLQQISFKRSLSCQSVHRQKHSDKEEICCFSEIIEGCRQMLQQVSTDCSFGNEHATATSNQLRHFTRF